MKRTPVNIGWLWSFCTIAIVLLSSFPVYEQYSGAEAFAVILAYVVLYGSLGFFFGWVYGKLRGLDGRRHDDMR